MLLVALLCLFAQEAPTPALKGLDPVELCAGREAPGVADHTATHEGIAYRFASAENLARFKAAPDRYAIQYGGSCGRMGPLSGACNLNRFLVYDGRIYVFASEQCRQGFAAAPERHIEAPDPVVPANDDEKKRGAELLGRIIEALGGEKQVSAVTAWDMTEKRPYVEKGETKQAVIASAWAGLRHRRDETWGTWKGTLAGGPGFGFTASGSKGRGLNAMERAFLERQALREPLAVVLARARDDFKATDAGAGKVGETAVRWLRASTSGATSLLGVGEDGRVLAIIYRGRMNGPIGRIVQRYSDFKAVGGLTLAHRVQVDFDDKKDVETRVYESIRINPSIEESFWRRAEE
jgi:YHS domain-containing protein